MLPAAHRGEVCKVSSSYRAGIGYLCTALFYFTDRYFARVSYILREYITSTRCLASVFLFGVNISLRPHISQPHSDESQVSINYITLLLSTYPSYPPIPLTLYTTPPASAAILWEGNNLEVWNEKKIGRLVT